MSIPLHIREIIRRRDAQAERVRAAERRLAVERRELFIVDAVLERAWREHNDALMKRVEDAKRRKREARKKTDGDDKTTS